VSTSVHRFATLLIAVLSTACTTKVASNTIKGPVTERRTRLSPSGALGKSTWRWDGRGFTGKIEWQGCRIDTTWKETEQSITSTRPHAAVPYVTMAAGVAMATAGFILYDYDGVQRTCTAGLCYDEDADNTLPSTLIVGSGLVAGSGFAAMKVRGGADVRDIKTEQKRASENGPCIQPKDIGELKLVLQISDKKFVTIRVERDWSARIEIPAGIELPRNVDLPVLMYSVPRKASHLAGRWHVVGHARAGADGVADSSGG
jgi:hypothetical protein